MNDGLLILPLILPFAGAILTAALPVRWCAWVTLVTTVLTLSAAVAILATVFSSGLLVYAIGGWAPPYGIVLVADMFAAALTATSALIACASALHVLAAQEEAAQNRFYHPLVLLLLTALGGVFLTGDLFNLYVFMEMVILSSFALVAYANKEMSAEVTFKYTVLSALASLLLLVSAAFVYAGAGTLNLADIAARVRAEAVAPFWPVVAALMLVAFLIKGAIFPFHFWVPDAHSAAPASISALLSGVLVKIGIYGIVRMTTLIFPDTAILLVIGPLGAVSALYGALAALSNSNLKRLLAYSTISNVGLILLAVAWGGPLGYLAATVHIINHALIKGSLFLSAGYLTERVHEQTIARLSGLAGISPVTTAALGFGALAIAGLPPLSGFVSKVAILQSGIAEGSTLLLAAAVLAAALAIGYSARAFALVCWGQPAEWLVEAWQKEEPARAALVAPLLLAGITLILGVWPDGLVSIAGRVASELNRPDLYVSAVLGGIQ